VAALRQPTDLESSHDFLWRVHQQVPAAGETAIFNRSHYERTAPLSPRSDGSSGPPTWPSAPTGPITRWRTKRR
jgi:hypothetical protein